MEDKAIIEGAAEAVRRRPGHQAARASPPTRRSRISAASSGSAWPRSTGRAAPSSVRRRQIVAVAEKVSAVGGERIAMNPSPQDWRLSVAPMMEWTDRHCRYFHRLLTRRARLYTEMVTTGALLPWRRRRAISTSTRPSIRWRCSSAAASRTSSHAAARLAERWGYDEVNLNCGCPSERVQRGAFGACLMAEPRLVADCVAAMRDGGRAAGDRQAPDRHRPARELRLRARLRRHGRDAAAATVFIVHARNAWLKGMSPKENRELPPLRHDTVAPAEGTTSRR